MEGRPPNYNSWQPGSSYTATIQNKAGDYLTSYIDDDDDDADVMFVPFAAKDPGVCDYTITEYNNTNDSPLSVAITFRVKEKTYRLCSNMKRDKKKIRQLCVKKRDLPPDKIHGTHCSFLFYMKNLSEDLYELQCADGLEQYLSYRKQKHAILKTVAVIHLDETCHMTISRN
ncbi:up regulated post tail amputation-1 protein S homeolog isoform X1 [Xenopus laevis]|nr:up regulated post tail amputation-1 protein S homeolog isoform X1 [Xenopus laevis]